MTTFEISVLFFLQLAFVLMACRLVGLAARLIGQPQVVGEMIAGVLIGPSFFGYFWPDLQARLFPKETMSVIFTVAQLGVAFYMFIVGLEFRTELIRERVRSAVSVSVAGIAVPFALGGLIGYAWSADKNLFAPSTGLFETTLYLGSAMSITAFPMLARIIYERGLTGTRLGTLCLAAGSIDDASAWCVLAVVLATFGRDPAIAAWAVGGGLAYAVFTLVVARPLLRNLGTLTERSGGLTPPMLSFTMMIAAVACWFTDWIGIYAVFGGFILGIAMPRGLFNQQLRRMMEPMISTLLLPFFFVWSGLNTRIGLVDTPAMWLVCLLIMAAAIAGKGLACGVAARLNGETPRDSVAIGALMNSRGLMELIIADIGLRRGIITPTLYCMLILMAVVTTLMATPIFELVLGRKAGIGSTASLSRP